MTREEERLVRYRQQRSKEAIDLAMQSKWQEAVEINQEILENFPRDVDASNRLGRAYMELGRQTVPVARAKGKIDENQALELEKIFARSN